MTVKGGWFVTVVTLMAVTLLPAFSYKIRSFRATAAGPFTQYVYIYILIYVLFVVWYDNDMSICRVNEIDTFRPRTVCPVNLASENFHIVASWHRHFGSLINHYFCLCTIGYLQCKPRTFVFASRVFMFVLGSALIKGTGIVRLAMVKTSGASCFKKNITVPFYMWQTFEILQA